MTAKKSNGKRIAASVSARVLKIAAKGAIKREIVSPVRRVFKDRSEVALDNTRQVRAEPVHPRASSLRPRGTRPVTYRTRA